MSQHTGSHKNSLNLLGEKYLNESHWPKHRITSTTFAAVAASTATTNYILSLLRFIIIILAPTLVIKHLHSFAFCNILL